MRLKILSPVPVCQPVYYRLGIGSLLLLLWMNSGSAYAGWVSLGDTDSDTRVYVDRSTLLSKGDLMTMWILYDFRSMRTVAVQIVFVHQDARRIRLCTKTPSDSRGYGFFEHHGAGGRRV